MCALPVTIAVLIPMLWPASRFFGIYAPWIALLATPLIMGVGTYQSDQMHEAYRFLAHRGVAPDGSWLVKHVVWLGLAFAVCGYVLLIDHVAWQIQPEMGLGVRYGVTESIANEFAPPRPMPRSSRARIFRRWLSPSSTSCSVIRSGSD